MTLTKKLRDAALVCSNVEYRTLLRFTADALMEAVDDLHRCPDEENMRVVQCIWSKAERILDSVPAEGTPAPLSGAPEAARLAA